MATKPDPRIEWLKCKQSASYFIGMYCHIYDATAGDWIPFDLWPDQVTVLDALVGHRLNVILKARQLGLTWLVLCFILWKMLFHPTFTALLFSRRENEAIYLLSKDRLRGIYNRLPAWMKTREILSDSAHVWQLSNGSVAYGFPTTAGDSYTASLAFVDEADLVPDLGSLMNAVKPTIDGGGSMVLLSRADKQTPSSEFKRTFRGAPANGWHATFLPWHARPSRTTDWYLAQKADIKSRTGSLDDLYQQYPATAEEALAPTTMDRRLPFAWLTQAFHPIEPLEDTLGLPYMSVYQRPEEYGTYVVGVDPAEGNPNSDDSTFTVTNDDTGEECAKFGGPVEPAILAGYVDSVCKWFNDADVMVERNNHGHAVILALESVHNRDVMLGWDGKPGWMSSTRGKALMYSVAADALREGDTIIHSQSTHDQLVSIEGNSLRAPEGLPDDEATSYCLSLCARRGAGIEVELARDPTTGWRG